MEITLTIRRSDEWILQQRLDTGENVAVRMTFQTDVTELNEASRRYLLATEPHSGQYHTECDLSSVHSDNLPVDRLACTVTAAHIDAVIAHRVALDRQRTEQREAAVREAQAKKEAEKAEAQAKKEALAAARELLKNEIAAEYITCAAHQEHCRLLGLYLQEFPLEVRRESLDRLAARTNDEDVATTREGLRDRLEGLIPAPIYLFPDGDEDDDDDDD